MSDAALDLWCRDLVSCLHATIATSLGADGVDPLPILGATWGFRQVPGEWRPEEFYFPTGMRTLGTALAPRRPLDLRWHEAESLGELADHIDRGGRPIAAVDNFHLPFRPAYGDVHAAHLVLVTALDQQAGTVTVADPMPPAFQGPIAAADFERAWSSDNPADVQDSFFSSSPVRRRWLSLAPVTDGVDPSPAWLHDALVAGANELRHGRAADERVGIKGLRAFLAELPSDASTEEACRALDEVYVLGWAMQAQITTHAELLRTLGATWRSAAVCEAASAADHVAHVWSSLRVTAAHGRVHGAPFDRALRRHARRLRDAHREAVDAADVAIDALSRL